MRLDLVVGPNGAGKSTFVELLLAPHRPGVTFVNADIIAAQRWPEDPQGRSYDAARVAARTRQRLLDLREPFIAETVFSHSSKLDLIDAASAVGYTVVLHALLVPEELSVHRVAHGGHAVPEEDSLEISATVATGRRRDRPGDCRPRVGQLPARRSRGGRVVRRRNPDRAVHMVGMDGAGSHLPLAELNVPLAASRDRTPWHGAWRGRRVRPGHDMTGSTGCRLEVGSAVHFCVSGKSELRFDSTSVWQNGPRRVTWCMNWPKRPVLSCACSGGSPVHTVGTPEKSCLPPRSSYAWSSSLCSPP